MENRYIDPDQFTSEELIKIMYRDLTQLRKEFDEYKTKANKLFNLLRGLAIAAISLAIGLGILSVKELVAILLK